MGLAHGIPGPLAALSNAWLAGYRTRGQRDAITFLSGWICAHAFHDEWGINWAEGIPLHLEGKSQEQQGTHPARAGWCYGAPGIARALWLAGTALEDPSLRRSALDAIEAVVRRPPAARGLFSATLCHGLAGLLQICLRFAQESSSLLVREHIPTLVTQILAHFNPAYPLGFRELDPLANPPWVDDPSWLSGAPGTILALLAAATAEPPDWDRALLIS